MTPIVPKPLTSGAKANGRFGKQDFVWIRRGRLPLSRRRNADFALLECRGGLEAALLLDDKLRRLRAQIEMHAFKGAGRQGRARPAGTNTPLARFADYHLLACTQLITRPPGMIWPLGPSRWYI